MATSTGPDLSGAVEAVEALMDDTCTVYRDAGDAGDTNALDQDTGLPIDPPDRLIYDGPCSIKAPSGLTNRPASEGGQIYTQSEYSASLPISYLAANPDAEPLKGDVLTVTSSRRDPALVTKHFRITDVVYKTMAVSRKCSLELRG